MQTGVQVSPDYILQLVRVNLTQAAAGQQDVKYLMVVPHEVAASGEAALRQGEGEEEGTAEEEAHLPQVVDHDRVAAGPG